MEEIPFVIVSIFHKHLISRLKPAANLSSHALAYYLMDFSAASLLLFVEIAATHRNLINQSLFAIFPSLILTEAPVMCAVV